jgi:XisI protein
MDKVKKYQDALVTLLNDYVEFLSGSSSTVKTQAVSDKEHNHFQLLRIGWDDVRYQFVFGVLFHFDIIDGKIWLQFNNTEFMVVDELIELGVPKSDIVLGFNPPNVRKMREKAVFA